MTREIAKTRTAEITKLHTEILGGLKVCLDKAIRIRELLTEQKESFPHGDFTKWIKTNLPFTDRTARNYMRVYRERDRLRTETVSDLKAAYKLLAPLKKSEEGEKFWCYHKDGTMVPVDFKTWVNGNTNFEAWYAAAKSEFYRRQYRRVHWDDEEEEEEHNRPTDMGVSPNLYPFFLCAFRTGVRLGELLALEWGDIDFNGRFIEVKRSYYRGRTSPTKTGKTRRVDMSNQLTETLRVLYAKKKRQGLRRRNKRAGENRF